MKRPSLLLVAGDPRTLDFMARALGQTPRLYLAREGTTALETLRNNDIDLILIDPKMAGLSGVEFLKQAQKVRPEAVCMLVPTDPGELKAIVAQELQHVELLRSHRKITHEMSRWVGTLFEANRELHHLNRMKDRFLAGCSHELKTPLVSGMGYLELILSGGLGSLQERQKKGLRIAYRNLARLLDLIENLLAMAQGKLRPTPLRVAPFNLRTLVEECVESLRVRCRNRTLGIRVAMPRETLLVAADERKIHSVLTNVLANAEKFTPERARIAIRAAPTRDGRCRVRVCDNGPGPEADSPREGLGIGLMLSREILKAHGGKIALGTGRRGGAVVQFDLPLARSPAKARPDGPRAEPPGRPAPRRAGSASRAAPDPGAR